jgi:hypothetical protein
VLAKVQPQEEHVLFGRLLHEPRQRRSWLNFDVENADLSGLPKRRARILVNPLTAPHLGLFHHSQDLARRLLAPDNKQAFKVANFLSPHVFHGHPWTPLVFEVS